VALALLHTYRLTPALFVDAAELRGALTRMLADRQIDTRRVHISGSGVKVYADLDPLLAFLTSCALVVDRPSFSRSQPTQHQIILETPGIALAEKIMAECPLFGWYRAQAEVIRRYFPALEQVDLTTMPYLQPDLTAGTAAVMPLTPIVTERARSSFSDLVVTPPMITDPTGDTAHAHV
jgi:hypothetical protein